MSEGRRPSDKDFTYFYLLFFPRHPKDRTYKDAERKAVVGVLNLEREQQLFRIEAWIERTPPHGQDVEAFNYDYYTGSTETWWWQKVGEVGPVSVAPNQAWEPEVTFMSPEGGENIWIKFLLFKGTSLEPLDQLSLIIPKVYAEEF